MWWSEEHWAQGIMEHVENACNDVRDKIAPYLVYMIEWLTKRIKAAAAGADNRHFIDRLGSFIAMYDDAIKFWKEWLALCRHPV